MLLFYRLTIVQILGTKVMKCIGSVFGTLQIDFPRRIFSPNEKLCFKLALLYRLICHVQK